MRPSSGKPEKDPNKKQFLKKVAKHEVIDILIKCPMSSSKILIVVCYSSGSSSRSRKKNRSRSGWGPPAVALLLVLMGVLTLFVLLGK